ncbi:MAG: polyprenyl synthetase family protein [Candidatus Eisenbacteria bacterium]|uniref:Polyprenyl synthetase family protein n=1 Tax=Eiseniibacteriota bacterium TaxID=2212470 RepID=A0A538TXR6_UNCEI|nr:MAG: polyprenyl synthetase family protein [Candidatus Eisenbacteria bacterium]
MSPAAAVAGPRGRSAGPLASRLRAFERYFASVLPPEGIEPRNLHEAMRYAALAPGKRLRPLLVLTACEAVGGSWRRALPAAAAVECVHAFSLVHDDLPALDDDDYRRGRATTHRKYGEALAILAGDALLALAFQEVARLGERGVPSRRVVEASQWLAYCTGSHELIAGQVLDLETEGRVANEAMVREIDVRKTGALMSAALRLGGLAGEAGDHQLDLLGVAGRHLGLAFQIHDDLLNRRSSLGRLGKRAGTDQRRGKATYPRAVGERAARVQAEQSIDLALANLSTLGPRCRNLARLVCAMATRER